MSIKQNITSLQSLLEQVNALPEAGGVELPELSNPATSAEVFANKELIDANGNKIVGTFTIEDELTTQNDLIAQIQAAIDRLPEAGGVELPTLSNEGSASDLMLNKELIDSDGNVVTGTMPDNGTLSITMNGIDTKSVAVPVGYTSGGTIGLDDTIDNEVDTQADLISQIMTALDSKTDYNTIYIGSSVPTNDFGINGDIYVVRS